MRVPMIAGNWKMNTTLSEAVDLVNEIRQELGQIDNVDKVVCPPFISLAAVGELIKGSSIKLGAQNIYFEERVPILARFLPQCLPNCVNLLL